MGIFDGCLLACDIDGTLMENGYIHPDNVEQIEFFMSEGGTFSISTGRSVGAISSVTSQLIRISPSVVGNGTMIYDYNEQKIVYECFLPTEDHLVVKDVLNSGLYVGIEVHSGERVFTLKQTKESDTHQQYEGLETTVVAFDDIKNLNWNKVLITVDNPEDFDKLKEITSKRNINSDFVSTTVVLNGIKRNYYEQLPYGVSKASALAKLCEIYNIKNGCYYAIGDYYNDVQMLKKADICAVPQGSPDDVVSLADYVTVPCKDGAVADFINYLTKIHQA